MSAENKQEQEQEEEMRKDIKIVVHLLTPFSLHYMNFILFVFSVHSSETLKSVKMHTQSVLVATESLGCQIFKYDASQYNNANFTFIYISIDPLCKCTQTERGFHCL